MLRVALLGILSAKLTPLELPTRSPGLCTRVTPKAYPLACPASFNSQSRRAGFDPVITDQSPLLIEENRLARPSLWVRGATHNQTLSLGGDLRRKEMVLSRHGRLRNAVLHCCFRPVRSVHCSAPRPPPWHAGGAWNHLFHLAPDLLRASDLGEGRKGESIAWYSRTGRGN